MNEHYIEFKKPGIWNINPLLKLLHSSALYEHYLYLLVECYTFRSNYSFFG